MACWRGMCRLCRRTRDPSGEDTAASNPVAAAAVSEAGGLTRSPLEIPEVREPRSLLGAPRLVSGELSTKSATRRPESCRIQDYYDLGSSSLGTGTFSTVRLATCFSTGESRAVKVIVKQEVKEQIWDFRKEMDITESLEHPNIIRVFEIFEDYRRVYIIMEVCTGGELFDRLVALQEITEARAATVLAQILATICYMHEQGVCHRDLKPENFIYSCGGPIETSTLKLIDFGLSRRFQPGDIFSTAVGTVLYVAPEVYSQCYSQACDFWSIGVILYLILCGKPPFDGPTPKKVVKAVRKSPVLVDGDLWDAVSDKAKDLIRGLLTKDPALRCTGKQAIEHPWLASPSKPCVSLGPVLAKRLEDFSLQNQAARSLQKQSMAQE